MTHPSRHFNSNMLTHPSRGQVAGLLVNSLASPLTIDDPRPHFSFQLHGESSLSRVACTAFGSHSDGNMLTHPARGQAAQSAQS